MERYHNLVMDNARWEGFRFRDGDIVISTPPKSGTTWMQMMCALLIFQDTALPAPLTELSPWLEVLTAKIEDVFAALEAQQHRRFIKSHAPLDGIPFDPNVTYISVGRDPRDVALSWDNHMDNLRLDHFIELRAAAVGLDDLAEVAPNGPPVPSEDPVERFWAWMEAPPFGASGLPETIHHIDTFWQRRNEPNVLLLRFGDLQTDLDGQMRGLADRLGIEVDAERWSSLVAAATFDSMRSRAAELAPQSTTEYWKDDKKFFNRGTSGQWRDMLDDEDQARYAKLAGALGSPELLAWLHG
jgi:aryl sulfotransferase